MTVSYPMSNLASIFFSSISKLTLPLQVTSLGAGQQIFQSGGQQYLIVNKALQGSGGRIQIVDNQQESARESGLVASLLSDYVPVKF